MARHLNIFLLLFFVFYVPIFVHAQIILSEIMYNPEGSDSGREWIEIQNIGAESVDITGWRLRDSSNHNPFTFVQGTSVIPAQGYAVITNSTTTFASTYPGYTGILLKTVFAKDLSNTGGTLSLRDDSDAEVDVLDYTSDLGGDGDGGTIQKVSGVWGSGPATLGTDNVLGSIVPPAAATSSDSGGNVGGGVSVHSVSEDLSVNKILTKTLDISAGRDRLVYVGSPIEFSAKSRTSADVSVQGIDYRWTFGDGGMVTGQEVTHTYLYPGEYVVVLNAEVAGIRAVSRVVVRVLEPKVSIIQANSLMFEISNNSAYEINLEGWGVFSGGNSFVFPRDTIVLAGRRISVPAEISRMSLVLDEIVSLRNPRGREYSSAVAGSVATATSSQSLVGYGAGPTAAVGPALPIQPTIVAVGYMANTSSFSNIDVSQKDPRRVESVPPRDGEFTDRASKTPFNISDVNNSDKEDSIGSKKPIDKESSVQPASVIVIEPPEPGGGWRWLKKLFSK